MTITNRPKSIEEYMALEWHYTIEEDAEGGWVAHVWPLNDFAAYGDTREEVERNWRGALESHLRGYIACGKAIPTGKLDVSVGGDSRGGSESPSDELTFA